MATLLRFDSDVPKELKKVLEGRIFHVGILLPIAPHLGNRFGVF